jgi:pyrroline-5-carboxylate reductase
MKLGFVGGGVMAEAILSGVLKQGVALAGEIVISDVVEARRKHLEATYSVTAVGDNGAAVKGADIVVLAVKPQNLEEVLGGLQGVLTDEQTALSIVAGASLSRIVEDSTMQRWCGRCRTLRRSWGRASRPGPPPLK